MVAALFSSALTARHTCKVNTMWLPNAMLICALVNTTAALKDMLPCARAARAEGGEERAHLSVTRCAARITKCNAFGSRKLPLVPTAPISKTWNRKAAQVGSTSKPVAET